jgi:hypothetical protein
MPNPNDHVLEVLLEMGATRRSDSALVRKCYEIQRAHQYATDRDQPLESMRKLVEQAVRDEIQADLDGAKSQ